MKKIILSAALLASLLLSGCGNAAQQRYLAYSQELSEQDSLGFTARLTAVYPDRSADFTLRYELSDGVQRVTVLEPESIRGVSARIGEDGTKLEYDGAILDTGDLDRSGLSPLSALPLLVEALKSGHANAFWTEEDCDVVELLVDDVTTVRVHFDAAGRPASAELISDGVVRVQCEIIDRS